MPVALLDLKRQYASIKPELDKAVMEVFSHNLFILGPEVRKLEEEIAALCGVAHGIGVASGTDALLIALRAAGVGSGDEVIIPNLSFFATAGVVSRLHAKPVFVDIEADSYNIDANLIEARITKKTKAIMPVHLFGQVVDMDKIMEIARRHNIAVIEDAAQAIGSEYKGRTAGSLGDYACFSFFPSKNLGGSGDGGMIVTNDSDKADACRLLRTHGEKPKYYTRTIGYNSRLDTLQAATLLVKLPHLRGWSETRRKHAAIYDAAFEDLKHVTTPKMKDYSNFCIYNQYTLASSQRDLFLKALKEAEIGHAVYYPVPLHRQECFADLGCDDTEFPVSIQATEEVFSIPVYPELTGEEQTQVVDVISRVAGTI